MPISRKLYAKEVYQYFLSAAQKFRANHQGLANEQSLWENFIRVWCKIIAQVLLHYSLTFTEKGACMKIWV